MIIESVPLINYSIWRPVPSCFSPKPKLLQLEPIVSGSILVIDPKKPLSPHSQTRNAVLGRSTKIASVQSVRNAVRHLMMKASVQKKAPASQAASVPLAWCARVSGVFHLNSAMIVCVRVMETHTTLPLTVSTIPSMGSVHLWQHEIRILVANTSSR